jgi:hypothetical protein
MSAEMSECLRCSLFKGEVALLRGEIARLRDSVLALTKPRVEGASVFEIVGLHEPQRLAISGPFGAAADAYYQVSLTYRDQLSARCMIPIVDPAGFLNFFDDLAQHKSGWHGEKKVASVEGQFAITCSYEGNKYRPEVSMNVDCALDYPSCDPYWNVQLRLDIDPDSLDDIAALARAVFANAAPEPGTPSDGDGA